MAIKSRSVTVVLILVVLGSCNTLNTSDMTTPIATRSPKRVASTEPPAPSPSETPDIRATAFFQAQTATESVKETLVAPFPSVCIDPFSMREFSPDGLWMTELCYSLEDDSLIMAVSKHDTSTLWKLVYQDYTQRGGIFWDEGFRVVHWSRDGRYAYINLFFHGDGGECFIFVSQEQYGKSLLRLDLQTGLTTTILPLKTISGYGFSFAPTGRRLVYESYSLGLKILDLQTGKMIEVDPARQFEVGGNYIWSPDGLQFVYSNVEYTDQWAVANYSLRVVDGKTGKEQIVLESAQNCFAVKNWKDNHVIVVESFDPDLKVNIIEYDLSLRHVLSESTAAPTP
jgi:Tol biopolymer transport system component